MTTKPEVSRKKHMFLTGVEPHGAFWTVYTFWHAFRLGGIHTVVQHHGLCGAKKLGENCYIIVETDKSRRSGHQTCILCWDLFTFQWFTLQKHTIHIHRSFKPPINNKKRADCPCEVLVTTSQTPESIAITALGSSPMGGMPHGNQTTGQRIWELRKYSLMIWGDWSLDIWWLCCWWFHFMWCLII